VAALEPRLTSVASLAPAMQQLGELRQPLERVGALETPMTRLAALGSILDRPLLLLAVAVAGLLAWGGVTFAAVRLAIVSAARADRRSLG
jgi:hypothetical protein